MKLWLLRSRENDSLWDPWYDKAVGFVVRARNEPEARDLAQIEGGDETSKWHKGKEGSNKAWLSSRHSTCIELSTEGPAEVILRDYNAA